eukprot:TRINITY_DN25_c2_g1_i1.p1 TRINITY_DN25_c2_g1~~TRINITY_DN25_c2_g1_i1.p1  ORF type:complete len:215 (-),score=58.10 TRINITY_DN25_c2_g1_i1:536-1180(-)
MAALTRMIGKMVRETGQALEVLGVIAGDDKIHQEYFTRHRHTMPLGANKPALAPGAWVAPTASVVGDVALATDASVWYGAVVRGDAQRVTVGARSNVQDDAVLSGGAALGEDVTVGHGAIIAGSTVGDRCLIGMKAVLDGADVASDAIIAANAVVRPGSKVLSGQMWAGNPAVFRRALTPDEKAYLAKSAASYAGLAAAHRAEDDARRAQLAAM